MLHVFTYTRDVRHPLPEITGNQLFAGVRVHHIKPFFLPVPVDIYLVY